MPEYEHNFDGFKLSVNTDTMTVVTAARTYKGAYYPEHGYMFGPLVPLPDDMLNVLEFDKVRHALVMNHLGDGPYCVLHVPTTDRRNWPIYFKYNYSRD
jgi:hypothetical protein